MSVDEGLEAERDAILAALKPVADGLVATFGSMCEVVLHDYRRPEESVVALAGSVTGRAVGGAMSEIGMRMVARGDAAVDELNYRTRTRTGTGQIVKSSTMMLRDSTGTVFGAVCVNLDVSAVTEAHSLLGALAGTGRSRPNCR
ncbi:Transcriptional regulator DauR [Streptomyces alboniger]